jgi:hypothetical protein
MLIANSETERQGGNPPLRVRVDDEYSSPANILRPFISKPSCHFPSQHDPQHAREHERDD